MPVDEETLNAILSFLGGIVGVVALLLWLVGIGDWIYQWWERRKNGNNKSR